MRGSVAGSVTSVKEIETGIVTDRGEEGTEVRTEGMARGGVVHAVREGSMKGEVIEEVCDTSTYLII